MSTTNSATTGCEAEMWEMADAMHAIEENLRMLGFNGD